MVPIAFLSLIPINNSKGRTNNQCHYILDYYKGVMK